jgi:hypothetical protein
MSCCGQGRSALRKTQQQTPITTAPRLDASQRRLLLHYQASAPVTVRGVATGRVYEFSAAQATQYVAEPDAQALLRSRFFKLGD